MTAKVYLGDVKAEYAISKATSEGHRKWSGLWWASIFRTLSEMESN